MNRLLLLATLLATSYGAIQPYIPRVAEYRTECKTCPRSLCPNQLYYDYEETFNATCWTHGTKIMGDNLWLKSEAGCYVTQYDVVEYPGDYTTDLKYCGSASEVQNLTIADATTKYKTECRICPSLTCDTISYLKEDTDLELTCWHPDGQLIIDDPYWLKTSNNCYVARKNLYQPPDLTRLDNCGPIPFLEDLWHNNENGTSDVNKREAKPVPGPFSANYLINITVGEEYSYCRSCTNTTCEVEKTYEFDQEVYVQCISLDSAGLLWWSLTTDFCYVPNSDFWQYVEGDYYRMPLCEYFDGKPPGSEDVSLQRREDKSV
ncbi:hypothetical protein PTMSG1_00342 [Pyrenophora teres f. maculata]|nr:hypothetical protein PTMSG1_00342 [Pyrenophora teres f. maculata]